MGHANSKPRKKGLEKERSRSRSRSFSIKSRKKENSVSNNNNVSNNDRSNENDTPTSPTSCTTTTATSAPSLPSPVSSSPPSSPMAERLSKSTGYAFKDESKREIGGSLPIPRKISKPADQSGSMVEKSRSLSNALRESTVFDEDEKVVELMDDDGDQDPICRICEEETLNMYSLEVCGHSICIPCLYAYSENQLKNLSPDQHEILCPVAECTCIISSSDLKAALETFGAHPSENSVGADGDGADGGVEKERRTNADEGEGDGGEGSSNGSRSGSIGRSAEEEVGESSSGRAKTGREDVPLSLPIQLTHSLEQLLSKGNYIHCPNPQCKFVFEKLPHSSRRKSEVVLDEAGNPISPEASKHREEHRFRCRICGTNFCAACKSVPYHLGFTCKQKIAAMRAKHCRFCDVALPANAKPHNIKVSTPALLKKKEKLTRRSFLTLKWKGKSKTDVTAPEEPEPIEEPKEFFVCKAKECTIKMGAACSRFLECGHVCAGACNDTAEECFCLKESCCEEGKVNGTEFCNICWTEALGSAPCFKLACSHIFHVSCITAKLVKEWPGPSISFAFMNCPLCSRVVEHRALDSIVSPFRHLFDQVKARAVQRLEFEGMTNDPRITDEASDFYGKPAEYAMSIFSFYMCFSCRNPYFGGRRQCEVPQGADGGAEAAPFNPQELLCGGCSTLNAKCLKHGKEYIEYKCRFCCSLATFYCGGKAHFCTACHDKAGQLVEFINWTTTSKCEPCKGPGLCPLGMQHKENGEEFSLGCSICRLAGV